MPVYDPVLEAEFGGETRRFRLDIDGQDELELACGYIREEDGVRIPRGLPDIARALTSGTYTRRMVREAVRLGLMGESMRASQATQLVQRFIDVRPGIEPEGTLMDALPIAIGVVIRAINPPEAIKKNLSSGQPDESPSPGDVSTPQPTTAAS